LLGGLDLSWGDIGLTARIGVPDLVTTRTNVISSIGEVSSADGTATTAEDLADLLAFSLGLDS